MFCDTIYVLISLPSIQIRCHRSKRCADRLHPQSWMGLPPIWPLPQYEHTHIYISSHHLYRFTLFALCANCAALMVPSLAITTTRGCFAKDTERCYVNNIVISNTPFRNIKLQSFTVFICCIQFSVLLDVWTSCVKCNLNMGKKRSSEKTEPST